MADRHVVIFVPPSWMLAGTVAEETATELVLRDAVYVESTASNESVWAAARDPRLVGTTWPLPDGTRVRRDAILILAPAAGSFRPAAKAAQTKAIKETK